VSSRGPFSPLQPGTAAPGRIATPIRLAAWESCAQRNNPGAIQGCSEHIGNVRNKLRLCCAGPTARMYLAAAISSRFLAEVIKMGTETRYSSPPKGARKSDSRLAKEFPLRG
jgi:hypothetical protein